MTKKRLVLPYPPPGGAQDEGGNIDVTGAFGAKDKLLAKLEKVFGYGTPEYRKARDFALAEFPRLSAAKINELITGTDDAFRGWATTVVPGEPKKPEKPEDVPYGTRMARLIAAHPSLQSDPDLRDRVSTFFTQAFDSVAPSTAEMLYNRYTSQGIDPIIQQQADILQGERETEWTAAFTTSFTNNIIKPFKAKVDEAKAQGWATMASEMQRRVDALEAEIPAQAPRFVAWATRELQNGASASTVKVLGPEQYLQAYWDNVHKVGLPGHIIGGESSTDKSVSSAVADLVAVAQRDAAAKANKIDDFTAKLDRLKSKYAAAAKQGASYDQAAIDSFQVMEQYITDNRKNLIELYSDVAAQVSPDEFIAQLSARADVYGTIGKELTPTVTPTPDGGVSVTTPLFSSIQQGSQQRAQAKAEQEAAKREAEITQRAASAGLDPKAVLDYAQSFPNMPPERIVSDFGARETARIKAEKGAQQAAQQASEALWQKQATDLIDAQIADLDRQLADQNLSDSVKETLRKLRTTISGSRDSLAKEYVDSQVAGKGAAPDAAAFLQGKLDTLTANSGLPKMTVVAAPTTTPTSAGGAGGPAPSPSAGTTTPPVSATPGAQTSPLGKAVTAASAPGAAGALTREEQDAALKAQQAATAKSDADRNTALRNAFGHNPQIEVAARNLLFENKNLTTEDAITLAASLWQNPDLTKAALKLRQDTPGLSMSSAISQAINTETEGRATGFTGREVQYQGEVVRPGDKTSAPLGQRLGIDQAKLSELLRPAPGGGHTSIDPMKLRELLTGTTAPVGQTGGQQGVRASLYDQILKKRGITGPITDTQTVSDIASELALGELQQQDAMRKITPGGFLETPGVQGYEDPNKKNKPPLAPAKRVF